MPRETARDHLCSRYAAVIAARARTTSRLTPRPSYKSTSRKDIPDPYRQKNIFRRRSDKFRAIGRQTTASRRTALKRSPDNSSVQSAAFRSAFRLWQLIQNFGDTPVELGNLKWFRENRGSKFTTVAQGLGIPCYEQSLQPWLTDSSTIYDRRGIHFGHGIIDDQEVDRSFSLDDL